MGTPQYVMLAGISMFTLALLALVFMLGRWSGERSAARAYVRNLEQSRRYLEQQRAHLEQQREALEQQRAHLDVRRRSERMPTSGSVRPYPGTSGDDAPTREIDLTDFRTGEWTTLPDSLNRRRHRRRDETA